MGFKQLDQGLVIAKQRYFSAVEAALHGNKLEHGPWLVAEDIPPELFTKWNNKREARWKLAHEGDGGRVLLYGDPSLVHETAAGYFSQMVLLDLMNKAGSAGAHSILMSASPLLHVVDGQKEPDFTLTPRDCLHFTPTVILEVAFRNESLHTLQQELYTWTARQDLAQLSIGIHIQTSKIAVQDPYLTILWKSPGKRHQHLHFGKGTQCSRPSIPKYMFRIPFKLLFANSKLANTLNGQDCVSIDLFEMRETLQQAMAAQTAWDTA